jgi:hypothetical protein
VQAIPAYYVLVLVFACEEAKLSWESRCGETIDLPDDHNHIVAPNVGRVMDQLETQVSDLRSFLTGEAPAGSPMSGYSPTPHHPASSSRSALGDNSAHDTAASPSAKRKADDDDAGGKQQRSKRNRVCISLPSLYLVSIFCTRLTIPLNLDLQYISIAWYVPPPLPSISSARYRYTITL